MNRQSILRRAFAEVMGKTPNGTPSMFEPLTDDGEFPDYMVESLYKEYEKIDVIVSSEAQARIAELEAQLQHVRHEFCFIATNLQWHYGMGHDCPFGDPGDTFEQAITKDMQK